MSSRCNKQSQSYTSHWHTGLWTSRGLTWQVYNIFNPKHFLSPLTNSVSLAKRLCRPPRVREIQIPSDTYQWRHEMYGCPATRLTLLESALGLVGQVSKQCQWLRQHILYATSSSVWQDKNSPSRPVPEAQCACCWEAKQTRGQIQPQSVHWTRLGIQLLFIWLFNHYYLFLPLTTAWVRAFPKR